MAITILSANLLTTTLSNYLVTFRNHVRPLTFTLIGMAIVVLIFYPLFTKLEEWVKDLSLKVVKTGKSIAGNYLGLVLVFITCLVVLFWFYAKMWYHIDILHILVTGDIGRYI